MKQIITLLLLSISIIGYSQKEILVENQNDFNEINQKQILDTLTYRLEEFYIKSKSIENIKNQLNDNLKKGIYKNILNPNEFANKLTTDLIEISKDLHFNVSYDKDWVENQLINKDELVVKKNKSEELIRSKKNNFGFRNTQILEGNVGYLKFDYFHDPAEAAETATSIMKFLENSDALIIDLRSNNGGVMELGQFLSSYFFKNKDLPLYKYYYYENKRKRIDREMWLLPSVPGNRLENVTLYILTSNATFSAAEWMSYSLQNLKRATIIGEQTAGGAHPVDRKILVNGFSINIPFGEIVDPITNLDFEGKGVTPDVKCAGSDALNTAHILALNNLNLKNTDSISNINWIIPIIKNRQKPLFLDSFTLKSYQGKYGKGMLKFENEVLNYKWNNATNFSLTPLEKDLFLVNGIDDFRIKIVFENKTIKAIKRIYQDGQERIYLKD